MSPRKLRKTPSGTTTNPALAPAAEPLRVGDVASGQSVRRTGANRVPFGSYLDPGVHRQFKATCVLEGIEMQAALEEAITAWLEKRGEPDSQLGD